MKRESHSKKTVKIQFPQTIKIFSHGVGQGDMRFVVTLWTPDKISCVCEYTVGTGKQQDFCYKIAGSTNEMVSACNLEPHWM